MLDEDNQVIEMANSAREKRLRDEALENFKKNSIYSEGAKPFVCEQKRERVFKEDFKKFIASLLVVSTLITSGVYIGSKIVDNLKRENDLKKADDYMEQKIVSIYEKNNIPYMLSDGKVILLENSSNKVMSLSKYFEDYNIDSYEFLYAVYKTGGIESLEIAVKGLGYNNVDNFLYEKYRDPDTGKGSLARFENNNEVGYVEGVKEIQKEESGKGLGI